MDDLPERDPGDGRSPRGWPVWPVSARVLATTGVGAILVLWGLTGWSVLALGVALGAAIVLRLLGALLLPRRLRERMTVLALPVAVLVLVVQSA